ncbi:MAG: NAD(P)H-dependent oxidoreductase [Firmicutes bacterium]|nr:NAD(P)H-dependent oxidoreductase [Bacillota bacterium]MBQ9016568.1 NAD(P)H-dependent oxidoreductase [Bacillota bacterium]
MAKELVTYFSVYGTARNVAEKIARQTGADLVEIQPVTPYDSNREHYDALARLAKREHDENQRPAIRNDIDIDAYDRIYVGYPMWWYTFPMILYTFFDKYDFSGKTIIPFNTHMGSGDGGTYDTIRQMEPGATVLAGLPVEMRDAEVSPDKAVEEWLAGLDLD